MYSKVVKRYRRNNAFVLNILLDKYLKKSHFRKRKEILGSWAK